MFSKLINNLQGKSSEAPIETRRRHERRSCDHGVTIIGERMYPLVDWSVGGIQIAGDERLFGVNQTMDVVMKFRMNGEVIDVPHQARVVRKTKNKVAFEFLPLTQMVRTKFQTIVDDFMAREFADSQLV